MPPGRPWPPHPAHARPYNPVPGPEPISILQGQGQGHLSQRKTVTIPPGSILAFQVAQLVIGSDWGEPWLGVLLGPRLAGQRGRETGRPEMSHRLAGGAVGIWLHSFLGQGGRGCQALGCRGLGHTGGTSRGSPGG